MADEEKTKSVTAYSKSLHIPKWKKNLEKTPTTSELSLVSLYDLWQGTEFCHDIIYLDEQLYTNLADELINNPHSKADTLERYNNYGFDIFPVPAYDIRAHKYSVKIGDESYKYYKDGFQTYTNLNQVANYLKNFNEFRDKRYEDTYESFRPISVFCSKYSNKASFFSQIDLYFYEEVEDKLIESDTAYLFQKGRANLNSSHIKRIYIEALKGAFPEVFKDDAAASDLVNKLSTNSDTFTAVVDELTDAEEFILKNTFVWVRGVFAGDYVDKKSFEQELNDRETPRWRNIVLSGQPTYSLKLRKEETSSLTDYDEFESNSDSPFTYYPKTAPSIDYLENNYVGDGTGWLDRFNDFGNEGNILRLNHPAFSYDGKKILGTPMWFDFFVGSSNEGNGFYREKPFVLPKDGNLNLDGRIISPTIDEIWTTIKMVLFGHGNDNADDGVIGLKQTVNTNDKNSTLENLKHFHFKYGEAEKFGDVLDYNIDSTIGTEVTRFIADPTQHTLRFDDYIAAEMKIFMDISEKTQKKYDKYKLDYYKKFVNIKSSDFKNLIFENSGDVHNDAVLGEGEDLTKLVDDNYKGAEYEIGKIYSTNDDVFDDLRLNPYPLSLRQLESRILNQAFNLKNFSRFVLNNFVPASPFASKGNSTLYTLHQGYNLEIETPNTNYLDSMKHEKASLKSGDGDDKFVKYTSFEAFKNAADKVDLSSDELYKHHYIVWLNGKWSPVSNVLDYRISPTGAENVVLNAKGEWKSMAEYCYIPTLHMNW